MPVTIINSLNTMITNLSLKQKKMLITANARDSLWKRLHPRPCLG